MTGGSLVAQVASAAGVDVLSAGEVTGVPCLDVPAQRWRQAGEAVAAASGQLDWLTGVDLGGGGSSTTGEIQVTALFMQDQDCLLVRTRVGYEEPLLTVSDLFPSASWHERETSEMLGVLFSGGDPRRLLLDESVVGHPLRRDFALAARLQVPWPGAEPGRRARIPGINPEWQR